MKSISLLLALLVASTTLGGCLGIEAKTRKTDAEKPPAAAANVTLPINFTGVKAIVGNLPCAASAVSLTETSSNIKHVQTAVRYGTAVYLDVETSGEIDANPNGTVISQLRRVGTPPLFALRGYETVNATDPAKALFEGAGYNTNAQLSGSLLDPGFYVSTTRLVVPQTFDVKYTTNGENALVGVEDRISLADTTKPLRPTIPSGGRGFYYYGYAPDLMLPANFGEAHRIAVLHIGDFDYFFVAPGALGKSLLIGRVLGTGTYARPELVKDLPTADPAFDVYATKDPRTNENLLYVANGAKGFAVYNVDDPAAPSLKVKVTPPTETPGADLKPAIYSTIQAAWVQGRRVLALGAETGSGEIRLFNVTEFNKPKLLGVWSADGRVGTPTMKLQILNGTLLAAAGPLGLVGFDLTKALTGTGGLLSPALHYTPPGDAPSTGIRDVVVRNGLIFAGDDLHNVHVAALGCFPLGDPAFSSTG